MSLWVDKHRPVSLDSLDCHTKEAGALKKLVASGDFPHLLFYGPPGAGKKTLISCLLRELYGSGVDKLRIEHHTFTAPSKKKINLSTVSSNYHLEVNPSDVGIYDRIVIQELIKDMASTAQLDTTNQREFKVHSLRRTMEKYMRTCRLVLCTESLSKDIVNVLCNVAKLEGLLMPTELAERIAVASDQNLRRSLLLAEVARAQHYPFTCDQTILLPDWQNFVADTASRILSEQSPRRVLEIRGRLYELLAHCVPPEVIFRSLLDSLLSSCDSTLKHELVNIAATHEHRMHLGQKPIFHLEAFVIGFMAMYKRFIEDTLGAERGKEMVAKELAYFLAHPRNNPSTGNERSSSLDVFELEGHCTVSRYLDKRVRLKLNGNREVVGVLRGFDAFMNMVLDDCQEISKSGQQINIDTVVVITHDTTLYTFGLPSIEYVLGVPPGMHASVYDLGLLGNCVILHARIDGEDVKRPYTPVTLDDFKGYVKFLIKAYRKNVNPNFPAGGKMTQYLESLAVGDAIEVSGPSGLIHYCGDGLFEVKGGNTRKVLATNVNMICGGTGLTPMYQLLKYILNSSSDKTKIAMIFANQTEKDILLRDELEQLRDKNPTRFRIWYTVESPPQHWTYDVGYLDQKMLEEHCYPASSTTVNLLCGPASMIKNACLPNLATLGHSKENILTF
ncbi:Replication factor C subunit 3 [Taenia crassiceps]|uniref:Replication factor C subunit 3 n=1 Tax=Taenia crassiceps TaxID=6207 RepID=A0ABR4QN37_9CEST